MEREAAAVTCDGRLFHRWAAATGNTTLCHQQLTDEYVEYAEMLMRQNVVVIWLQCLPVYIVCHILSSEAVYIVARVSFIRDLGIYLDFDMSIKSHAGKTASSQCTILYHPQSIRRSVSRPVLQWTEVTLVLSWLDFSNVTLTGSDFSW